MKKTLKKMDSVYVERKHFDHDIFSVLILSICSIFLVSVVYKMFLNIKLAYQSGESIFVYSFLFLLFSICTVAVTGVAIYIYKELKYFKRKASSLRKAKKVVKEKNIEFVRKYFTLEDIEHYMPEASCEFKKDILEELISREINKELDFEKNQK
jgi:hypothetical protein